MQKAGFGQANDARLEATGYLNWSPTIFATRSDPFTLHASRVTTRGFCLVEAPRSIIPWLRLRVRTWPLHPTCGVATVRFWCTMRWHSRRPLDPMIRTTTPVSSRRDYSQLTKPSRIRGRKGRLLNNALLQNMEGSLVRCRSAPSCHVADAWQMQIQPKRRIVLHYGVRIRAGAPADALSLRRIYAKAPAILVHRLFSTRIFHCPRLDSPFLPPSVAGFTKFLR